MDTLFVSFDDVRLLEALNRSEVIAFPTETVYGLGVRYDSSKAFDKWVEVKKRPPLKPFTLMGGDNFNILDYAYLNRAQLKLVKHCSPRPVTFLVRPKENLPKHVTLGLDTLGVRISGDKKLREFITRVGVPLLVPSANKSSCPPLDNSKDVYEVFKGEIPYIVDDICSKGLPSTIVDISKDDIRLVRQGDISFETIKEYYKECTKWK